MPYVKEFKILHRIWPSYDHHMTIIWPSSDCNMTIIWRSSDPTCKILLLVRRHCLQSLLAESEVVRRSSHWYQVALYKPSRYFSDQLRFRKIPHIMDTSMPLWNMIHRKEENGLDTDQFWLYAGFSVAPQWYVHFCVLLKCLDEDGTMRNGDNNT